MSLLTPLVSALPNILVNGTPNDASQVMADFNGIVNNINARLNATGATGGDQYVGLTTNSIYNGTSVFDALTQLADRQTVYTDTGAVNALVVTPNPAMTSLTKGQVFWFSPANTTTSGSATINISGIGAVGLANWDGTLLLAGQLIAGSYYLAVTAGPATAVRVLNPSSPTGSFTTTLSDGGATGTINYRVSADGKNSTIYIASNIIHASTVATLTASGIPTIIQSSISTLAPIFYVQNNSAAALGVIASGINTGTWTLGVGFAAGGFATSNNKGFLGSTVFQYPLS